MIARLITKGVMGFVTMLMVTTLHASDVPMDPPAQNSNWNFVEAGLIPLQAGGRMKPFDTFAREATLFITGSKKWNGWEPTDLVLSWLTRPDVWDRVAFIKIGRKDVLQQLLLDQSRTRFSPSELTRNEPLIQYAGSLSGQGSTQVKDPNAPVNVKSNPREDELKAVLDRLSFYRTIVTAHAFRISPRPDGKEWGMLAELGTDEVVRQRFGEMVRAYAGGDRGEFERRAAMVKAAVEGEVAGWSESTQRTLWAESFYNRWHPFLWAWISYLLAAVFWLLLHVAVPKGWALWHSLSVKAAWIFTVSGFLIHCFGFGLRCYIAGRPPVTNMYESVVWVALGSVFFSLVIYAFTKQRLILTVSTILGALGLMIGDAAPAVLDSGLHPLVPVLRSNLWLTVHVLTITLGYSAFALTLGISNVTLFHFLRSQGKQKAGLAAKVLGLNNLTYRAMQFGVVLLAAGTILGGVWADYSWGRFWGWDPKEVWALIALLAYIAVLHARYVGWVGQFGFAALSIVGFMTVVMAWYGVNFVLGVGLHSYGFTAGGSTMNVGIVCLIQMAYVGWATWVHRRKTKDR